MDITITSPFCKQRQRLFSKTKAHLRLNKGVSLHGETQDLNEEGCQFFPTSPSDEVQCGDNGILFFTILGNGREMFTEIPMSVNNISREWFGVVFDWSDSFSSTDITILASRIRCRDIIQPGNEVFVHRRNGQTKGIRYEYGWKILSHTEPLPPKLLHEIAVKQMGGVCVICHKTDPDGQCLYKVYYALDLVAIQLIASLGGDGS